MCSTYEEGTHKCTEQWQSVAYMINALYFATVHCAVCITCGPICSSHSGALRHGISTTDDYVNELRPNQFIYRTEEICRA